MRDRHAAQHERAGRPPRGGGRTRGPSARVIGSASHVHRRATRRSSGVVILRFSASPGTTATRPPSRSTSTASSVPGKTVAPRLVVRLPQSSRRKACGVCDQPEARAVQGGLHDILAHALHRLAHRETAGGGAGGGRRRRARARSAPARDERPHRVVHQHPLGRRAGRLKPEPHRLLPLARRLRRPRAPAARRSRASEPPRRRRRARAAPRRPCRAWRRRRPARAASGRAAACRPRREVLLAGSRRAHPPADAAGG